MSTSAIVETARSQGFELSVEGDDLVCRGPKSLPTPEPVEQLGAQKPQIMRLIAPSPFDRLQAEWRAAVATSQARFSENGVEPDTGSLEATVWLQHELDHGWRLRWGGTEADARALLEAVYAGLVGRLEEGRPALRPLYGSPNIESPSGLG